MLAPGPTCLLISRARFYDYSAYTTVSDGKGGRIVVRKPDRPPKNKGGKGGKDGKGGKGGRGGKGGKDGKGRRGGGPDGNMSDFRWVITMTSQLARWRLKRYIQGADQREHQSSASLAFVRGIH